MSDKRNDDQPKDDAASEVSWRFRDIFKRLKREPKANSLETNSADAQEEPLVRETRRLAEVTRQLVNWTRVIAAIAVLAFAASLLQWEAMRGQLREMRKAGEDTQKAIAATNRLADAARDQADIAMQTQKPQLRAYLGPTFNNFRLTAHPADCDPSTTTFSAGIDENASTIFCYHFKNYGHTAAKFLSMCSNRNNGSFIFPDNSNIYIIVDRILHDCKETIGPPPAVNWVGSGEERAVNLPVSPNDIHYIFENSRHEGLVLVIMKYFDIIGDRHNSYVCRNVIYPPSPGRFWPCTIGVPQDD